MFEEAGFQKLNGGPSAGGPRNGMVPSSQHSVSPRAACLETFLDGTSAGEIFILVLHHRSRTAIIDGAVNRITADLLLQVVRNFQEGGGESDARASSASPAISAIIKERLAFDGALDQKVKDRSVLRCYERAADVTAGGSVETESRQTLG